MCVLARSTVAVIIPTFNSARFLADALASVVAQTRRADEIIVVDDGSTDDPAAVVTNFENVRLIRQENCGRSVARNVGLRSCSASHVVFLDADDRLLPMALEAGLEIAKLPDCALVYGGFYQISEDASTRGPDCFIPVKESGYLELLQFNVIGALHTALHKRDCLLAVGGFDEALSKGEDYDLYLRLAQRFCIASYSAIIAEYRTHGQSTSKDFVSMLQSTLEVLDRHEARITCNAAERAALRRGQRNGATIMRGRCWPRLMLTVTLAGRLS